jgi:hypothetical protein
MEAQHTVRYRVNVSVTSKGVYSFDCTVELSEGLSNQLTGIEERILLASDALVAALERRYANGERHATIRPVQGRDGDGGSDA